MPNLNMDNLSIKEKVVDRVVRFFDPVKGEWRFHASAILALSGSDIGASRAKRSLIQWRTNWGNADSDTHYDFTLWRNRSRGSTVTRILRGGRVFRVAVLKLCLNLSEF